MEEKPNKDVELNLEIVQDTNERIRKKLKSIKKEKRKKEEKVDELKREISKKKKKIRRLEEELNRARENEGSRKAASATPQSREGRGDDHSRGKGASRSKSVQQPSKDELTTEVGQVFVEWCKSAGATMVDRHAMFADKVTERLPEAEVSRVFREKNAAGILFVEDAQDAVEYWAVRIRGRDLLLPQPDRSGFREVEKCFEGDNIAPEEVEEIYPGELRPKEGKRVLKAKGLIS